MLSGLMLGFSFPPSPFGVLACFGLVPLLIVLSDIAEVRPALRQVYVAMLVFHIITLNWTGGYEHGNDVYMMIAGAFTMLWHPLFYFIPLGLYVFVKKHLGEKTALAALPFLWVAYEYTHSLSEWSFPWLTIGNSQSYNLAGIQFINITGVYGLSLWILLLNVVAYILYSGLAQNRFAPASRQSLLFLIGLLVLYFGPTIHGSLVLSNAPTSVDGPAIRVGMVQSNIDPWEKWKGTWSDHLAQYLAMTDELMREHSTDPPELILWPETAIPYYLLLDFNKEAFRRVRSEVDRLGVSVLTGLPHAIYYADSTLAPPSAKRNRMTGQRYDAFNAAALISSGVDSVRWYAKMKMVPIAERVPYADAFAFLDFLRWDVGIGGWQIGPDTVIFEEPRTGARFATVICYESVYPDFVAAFVRKGAEFLTIITIDSWWGRMSGAFQHHQFAIFRAIENRRWIARCAVGGFSSYIDPYGRVFDKTALFTKTHLVRTIGRGSDLTHYTRHGDWLPETCLVLSGLVLAAAIGQKFRNKRTV